MVPGYSAACSLFVQLPGLFVAAAGRSRDICSRVADHGRARVPQPTAGSAVRGARRLGGPVRAPVDTRRQVGVCARSKPSCTTQVELVVHVSPWFDNEDWSIPEVPVVLGQTLGPRRLSRAGPGQGQGIGWCGRAEARHLTRHLVARWDTTGLFAGHLYLCRHAKVGTGTQAPPQLLRRVRRSQGNLSTIASRHMSSTC
jgi:hypothetical protein